MNLFNYDFSLSKKVLNSLLITTGLLLFSLAQAQELDPRSYTNIPINQNFIVLGYALNDGDVNTEPDTGIENLTLRTEMGIFAYVRTFDLSGKSAKLDVSFGRACTFGEAEINNENRTRRFCGVTDSKIRLNYNFYGAPALALKEYVGHKKQLVMGTSLQINIPTGEYDSQFLFNIGSNRWFFKPEIGMSIPVDKWEFDFALSAKIYTKNDDFYLSQTLEQDPVYNFQMHIIYYISRSQWLGLSTNYFRGGEVYIDGVNSEIKHGNHRGGLTYSFAINSQHTIKLSSHTGVTTRLGNDSDTYAVTWAYRWQ